MKCPTCETAVAEESVSCPSCGSSLDDGFAATKILDAPPKSSRIHTTAPPTGSGGRQHAGSIHSISSPAALGHGRFVPGDILADRYRIVGLLGRGGMGEVYRADDLKLEQPVALKFLPEQLTSDGAALARFHREVRVARQISHRNVCRVYDIGETDGLHFLSMEYIKGEELSSALKRFGRLPQDKAVEVARQICAGLAAAHDAGVLHRDLKPANVMIDELGNARVMDFGLAGLTEEFRGEVALEGTPEYMSPEQFEGKDLTVRSDIYSLGLVLYELFTGKKAFTANSLPDLIRLRRTETMPEHPSLFVRDIDPVVERVIERCLAADPKERPASALQVAAALPGGDPLAAALAAGETPSPEMVAAAPKQGVLSPATAVSFLVAIGVVLALALMLSSSTMLHRRVPLEKSAQGLKERASEVSRRLGYTEASDSESGFNVDGEYLNYIREKDKSPARWDRLSKAQPPALMFWYRQSPRPLLPFNGRAVTQADPPRTISEMSGIWLDMKGRLISFYGVPPHLNEPKTETPPDFDWSPLFTEAGLDQTKFERVEPKWLPLHPYDALAAWEGAYPDNPDMRVQVIASAFRGRPIYFHLIDPWNQPTRQVATPESWSLRVIQVVLVFALAMILLGAVLLARRNLRTGRGDRKGAFRLALVALVLNLVAWVLAAHHVLDVAGETNLFFMNLAWSLMIAGLMWLVYIAVEPSVRRRWPHRIISWSRLLGGDFKDPLVGRDILVGALFGFGGILLNYISQTFPRLLGLPPATPVSNGVALNTLEGTQQLIPTFALQVVNSFIGPAGALFLLLLFSLVSGVLLRLLARRLGREWLWIGRVSEWLAIGLIFLIYTLLGSLSGEHPAFDWVFAAVGAAMSLFLLLRFGLLAAVAADFFTYVFVLYPITTDFSAWYAGGTIFALGLVLALVAYGFYISLAGQKLFKGDLIGE